MILSDTLLYRLFLNNGIVLSKGEISIGLQVLQVLLQVLDLVLIYLNRPVQNVTKAKVSQTTPKIFFLLNVVVYLNLAPQGTFPFSQMPLWLVSGTF